jgi:hypothetical protein
MTDTKKTLSDGVLNPSSTSMADETNNIFKSGAVGSLTEAIGNSIYGINHRQTPGAIQLNKDYHGLTFFTRPELNLSSANLRNARQLVPLLTSQDPSIHRIIRCLLDPKCKDDYGNDVTCVLVDRQQAFIPMLTNHLISISGYPDVMAPTMSSQPGLYQEAFSFVDGVVDNYTTYDIQASFRNIPGDPITLLFLLWVHYASKVYQGVMSPYPSKIIENEIDYQTRIYRLVLDHNKRFVKKIAACGAAFPLSSPIGSAFNVDAGSPISDANHQISIPFRCMGAMYQDDILIHEFNRTTAIFNPLMDQEATKIEAELAAVYANANSQGVTDDALRTAVNLVSTQLSNVYVKIPMDALPIFNNRGYPHINIDTYELGWYIDKETYDGTLQGGAVNQLAAIGL